MKKQTGAGERPRHWLLLTAYTGCPKHPLQVKFMNIVTEISYWCHCSYNLTLNKFPKTCIPVKWIFSEICDLWYWHDLFLGQMQRHLTNKPWCNGLLTCGKWISYENGWSRKLLETVYHENGFLCKLKSLTENDSLKTFITVQCRR